MVEPRYDELFSLVQAELRRNGFEDILAAGIVLTGGSSKIEGVAELAEEIFHMPVRIGFPQQVSGLADAVKNPIYSTGVGLLLYGQRQQQDENKFFHAGKPNGSVINRMKKWIKGNL